MNLGQCTLLANEDRFFDYDTTIFDGISDKKLTLPPLSCWLFLLR
jgi:hypothetical protein